MMNEWKSFWNEEDGFGTVELVILIAILVGIAVLFGTQVRDFVTNSLKSIFGSASSGVSEFL